MESGNTLGDTVTLSFAKRFQLCFSCYAVKLTGLQKHPNEVVAAQGWKGAACHVSTDTGMPLSPAKGYGWLIREISVYLSELFCFQCE